MIIKLRNNFFTNISCLIKIFHMFVIVLVQTINEININEILHF